MRNLFLFSTIKMWLKLLHVKINKIFIICINVRNVFLFIIIIQYLKENYYEQQRKIYGACIKMSSVVLVRNEQCTIFKGLLAFSLLGVVTRCN